MWTENKLAKQKEKTGVAILGNPPAKLSGDAKFQGDYLKDALLVGESMAQASLLSEVVVLMGAGVAQEEFHKYIGRGQYPKIKNKPQVRANPKTNKYVSGQLNFWTKIKKWVIFGFRPKIFRNFL